MAQEAVLRRRKRGLRGRGGAVALGVVVVLGIWLFFDLKRPVREPDANPLVSEYTHVLSNEVTRVEVKRKSGGFILAKSGGQWSFVVPANLRADTEQVDSWLRGILEGASVSQTVEGAPSDLATYGLDKPEVEVVLHTRRGSRTLQLGKDFRTGQGNAPGELFFAREKADGRLFMVSSSVAIALRDKTVDELRDRRLFEVEDSARVNRLSLTRPTGTVEVRRTGGDDWTLVQPFQASADRTNVTTLVDQLRLATASDFVEENAKDLARYGLDSPALVIRAWDNKGEHAVRFGKARADGKVYAARDGESQVVTVEKFSFQGFDKTVADLRDLRLITLDPEKVRTLEIRNPHGTTRLQRTGKNEWEIVDPAGGRPRPANAETVERILSTLRGSAFRHVAEAPADLSRYGLDKPRITVTLNDGAGTSQVYALGKTNAEGDYYARGVPNAVFTVKSYTYADLNVLPGAFEPATTTGEQDSGAGS